MTDQKHSSDWWLDMTTVITSTGQVLSKKLYVSQLFDNHIDSAVWLTSCSSRTKHLVIVQSGHSPSICNRLFITKDLFDPDDTTFDLYIEHRFCKTCERLLAKRGGRR